MAFVDHLKCSFKITVVGTPRVTVKEPFGIHFGMIQGCAGKCESALQFTFVKVGTAHLSDDSVTQRIGL
jgi:hypothetical protein